MSGAATSVTASVVRRERYMIAVREEVESKSAAVRMMRAGAGTVNKCDHAHGSRAERVVECKRQIAVRRLAAHPQTHVTRSRSTRMIFRARFIVGIATVGALFTTACTDTATGPTGIIQPISRRASGGSGSG